MDRDRLRAEVTDLMRSCLVSSHGEYCTLKQLNKDYKTLMGEWIPLQKLGFKKLEDLILSETTKFVVKQKGNELLVKQHESEKSAHISEMVAKQKAPKKRPPRGVRFFRGAPPPRLQHMTKWRPKWSIPTKYQGSQRPQAVNHSQFVHKGPTATTSYKAPFVASRVVVPEHSPYNGDGKPSQPAQPPGKKVNINQRLANSRTKEHIKTVIGDGSQNGGWRVTSANGTSNNSNVPSNFPSNLARNPQKPAVQERTVINNDSLDPLASTKKRLIKKMSELSLERDSGNSSPTSDILPPSPSITPEFIRTSDPLADLKYFAELNKLGEVKVDIAQFNPKRKKFSCKIKVGSKHTYSSYPNEYLNPLEAQNFCCEEALADLIPKFRRKSLMIASEQDILERIPPMLEKHPHGIWASQLTLDYSDRYNEMLADDWLKVIDVSPCVQIQKISDEHILYHCRPGDKGQRRSTAMLVSNVSVPANTIQSSEDGRLTAHVTCVMSASEIWCQQAGTEESDHYADMMDRLQIYYQEHEHQLIPSSISVGGFYIAKYEDAYYRARAVNISEHDVECFFIDWGDALTIPRSDIFNLKREYASAQAQAFVCRLSGLEDLYEVTNNSQSLAALFEKQVVIEIAAEDTNTNDALPVFMYDCKTGQSINQDLIPKLTMELATPNLQADGITTVYVSNIEKNGNVYVQVRTQGYENWLKLKGQIEEQINLNPPKKTLYKVTRFNSNEKLYLWKLPVDGSWNRIKLIDWSPDGDYAQIYLVDDGRDIVIHVAKEELYPLEAINDIFNNYPHQAVRVRIDLDKIPSNFVELAHKVIPKEQPVLLKIVGTAEDHVPLVKLFIRRDPDHGLFCINTSISLEIEINSKKEEEENNNLKGKFKLGLNGSECVPSTGTLKCPPLPVVGAQDYYEVFVPTAVSPYNFFVQPIQSKTQLNEMMERLQRRYKNVHYGNLKVDDVSPGNIYASKHDDGFWYRTSVIKVIHSGSVSVFYCDFGYYQTLPVKQLIPLDKEFMELPYQALKAKLGGVKPTRNKWTMENCEQFKGLIEKKHLHAALLTIEKDILYESDIVLKLILCDASSDDDIFIDKELIKMGIAVPE